MYVGYLVETNAISTLSPLEHLLDLLLVVTPDALQGRLELRQLYSPVVSGIVSVEGLAEFENFVRGRLVSDDHEGHLLELAVGAVVLRTSEAGKQREGERTSS